MHKTSPSSWGTNKASADACNEIFWAVWLWHFNEEQGRNNTLFYSCEYAHGWTWTCFPFIVCVSQESKIKAQVHLGRDNKKDLNLHKHLLWRQTKQDSSWILKSSLTECADTAVILYSPFLPTLLPVWGSRWTLSDISLTTANGQKSQLQEFSWCHR